MQISAPQLYAELDMPPRMELQLLAIAVHALETLVFIVFRALVIFVLAVAIFVLTVFATAVRPSLKLVLIAVIALVTAVLISVNAVVIVVWAVLLLALSRGIFNPVDSLKDAPRWLLVVMYLGAFAIPFTAVGYLLLDKRRLRAREPFSRHTWKQELPFCLGVAAVSFLIALLVAAFGYPRP
jgi:hypothetical protein